MKINVPEKAVLKAITDYLEYKNILYIRINPIRLFNDKKGNLRAGYIYESQKGAPDIIAFPNFGLSAYTRPIALEAKSSIGKQSPDQLKWQEKWEELGNKYILVRSLDDLTGYL